MGSWAWDLWKITITWHGLAWHDGVRGAWFYLTKREFTSLQLTWILVWRDENGSQIARLTHSLRFWMSRNHTRRRFQASRASPGNCWNPRCGCSCHVAQHQQAPAGSWPPLLPPSAPVLCLLHQLWPRPARLDAPPVSTPLFRLPSTIYYFTYSLPFQFCILVMLELQLFHFFLSMPII